MQRENVVQMRAMFSRLAQSRIADGAWSDADRIEAAASIRAALESGDAERIKTAADWLRAETAIIDAAVEKVRETVSHIKARAGAAR